MSRPGAPRPAPRSRPGTLALICVLVLAAVSATAAAALTVTQVEIRPEPHQLTIALSTADREQFDVQPFTLADPPRLVFDLPSAKLDANVPETIPVSYPGIKQVRLGQFTLDPDMARLVVDLSAPIGQMDSDVAGRAGSVQIVLRGAGPVALSSPTVTVTEGALLVRLPSAGRLGRSVGYLDRPPRVYADLENGEVDSYARDCEEAPLRQIRMAQQPPRGGSPVARIVVELREQQAYSVFSDGLDLVIAVGPKVWALPVPEYAAAGRLRGKTIVVDPGHGGADTGARGGFDSPSGQLCEKDIALDIAQRLARLLKAEGANATMTRDDDGYVPLRQRAAIANRLKADALISIHCNSCDRPNTLSGTSVYYDHPHSAELAGLVQRELLASLGTADKGVRNANFAVIRRTTGPGVLVEAAFINHEGDRERLIHPGFRERAARAMLRGVIAFVSRKASAGGDRE